MALPLPYPGVQVQELPPGARTITGVSTSVTAFVGRAARGPVEVATTCSSFADFGRKFGGIWAPSTLSYAVYQYFLNGGTEAVIVRLAPGASSAAVPLPTATQVLALEAASPGLWGNQLRVSSAPGTAADTFTLVVRELDPADPSREVGRETFLDVSVATGHPRVVDRVLAQGSTLIRVRGPLPTESPAPATDLAAVGGADAAASPVPP
ncbi:MAG: phage tail sheath family protein, partial [Myxococcota bacterium]